MIPFQPSSSGSSVRRGRRAGRARQNGLALVAFVAIVLLGIGWLLLSRLNAGFANATAAMQAHNAAVLSKAKQALIGYVALQAARATEPDPGRLPCPEPDASAGGAHEGASAGNCGLSLLGRFPWRTVGLDRLVDASGEPLWLAVGPGWAKMSSGADLLINSNSPGTLTVDGVPNAAVALIIAPGPPMNVQASAGCAARNQMSRPAPSPAINAADYVECFNLAAASYSTGGPGASFNDQVAVVTVADLMPAIEAAIADRFARQIAPQIRSAYSAAPWPSDPVLPFAAPFGDPTASPANKFQGSAGATRGLLPATYSTKGPCTCSPAPCACTPAACSPAVDARCDPSFVAWRPGAAVSRTGGQALQSYSCSVSGSPTVLTCTLRASTSPFLFREWMNIRIDATAEHVGMALRQLNPAVVVDGIDRVAINPPYGYALSAPALNADGSASVSIQTRVETSGGVPLAALGSLTCEFLGVPLCYEYTVSIPMALFSDHPIVDPGNAASSWFFRNKWHELTYYAAAPNVTPAGTRSCTTVTGTGSPDDCLSVSHDPDSGRQRGLVVIGGRRLGGQARPPASPSDLLEDANAAAAAQSPLAPPYSPFTARAPGLAFNQAFNDRVVVIDKN